MYQVRQWACSGHSAHGRTSALQYRLESSTRLTLSSVSVTTTGLRWKGRSLFQLLPDSSVSHLNYGSRSYDIRYVGHLWVVFATSSRSSTERYVGHLLVVFATSSRSSTERNLQPQVRLNTTWTIVTCRWLWPWFVWDIFEWYLLFHCGAVLRGMVCRASRCAIPESMGQYSVSLWTWSARRLGMAMDWSAWESIEQVWHTQQGTFRRKRPPDVRDDPMRGQ